MHNKNLKLGLTIEKHKFDPSLLVFFIGNAIFSEHFYWHEVRYWVFTTAATVIATAGGESGDGGGDGG